MKILFWDGIFKMKYESNEYERLLGRLDKVLNILSMVMGATALLAVLGITDTASNWVSVVLLSTSSFFFMYSFQITIRRQRAKFDEENSNIEDNKDCFISEMQRLFFEFSLPFFITMSSLDAIDENRKYFYLWAFMLGFLLILISYILNNVLGLNNFLSSCFIPISLFIIGVGSGVMVIDFVWWPIWNGTGSSIIGICSFIGFVLVYMMIRYKLTKSSEN